MSRSILVVAAVGWILQLPAPQPAAAPSTNTASVAGVVTTTDTPPMPVRRAVVTLAGDAVPLGRAAITDDDGRFLVDGLPAGRFTVSAAKPAYVAIAYGATQPGDAGSALSVRAGEHVTDVVVRVMRGAVISGRIRDPHGEPAPNVQVVALRRVHDDTYAEAYRATYSDDRGQYRLYGLWPGDYLVVAMPPPEPNETTVASGPDVDATLAALARGQRTGTASSPAPAPPRLVRLAPVLYPGVSDPSQAQSLHVGPGEDRAGTDFSQQWVEQVTVSGTVVSPTGVVPSLDLTVIPDGPVLPVSLGSPRLRDGIGADGQFQFMNVTPGRYRLEAQTSLRNLQDPKARMWWARMALEVNSGDVSDVRLVLRPAVSVSGRLDFDGSTSTAPDVRSVRVWLIRAAAARGEAVARASPFAPSAASVLAESSADGAFELNGIVPGQYQVIVQHLPPEWRLRSVTIGGRVFPDGRLDIGEDATDLRDVVVSFSDRPTALKGTVTVPAGQSPASFVLVVFPTDPSLWTLETRVFVTRPDSQGLFVISNLPPGDYVIGSLSDVDAGHPVDRALLGALAASGTKVTVADGATVTQDVRIGKSAPR